MPIRKDSNRVVFVEIRPFMNKITKEIRIFCNIKYLCYSPYIYEIIFIEL